MKNSITIAAWAASAVAMAMASAAVAESLDPIFADQFETPEPDPPPSDALCTPDGFQYPPIGYRQDYSPSLEQLWLDSTGEPVGGALATIRLEGGTYTAMRFTRGMFGDHTDLFTVNGDTSNVGTGLRGAATSYVAVSECAGDLRVADNASQYESLHARCRLTVGGEGPFMYLNWGRPSTDTAICNLDPAKTYYFNVVFDNPIPAYDASRPCTSSGGLNQCGFRIQMQ